MPQLTMEQREEIRVALLNRLRAEHRAIACNERLEAALINNGLDFDTAGLHESFLLHYGSDWDVRQVVDDEMLERYLKECVEPTSPSDACQNNSGRRNSKTGDTFSIGIVYPVGP